MPSTEFQSINSTESPEKRNSSEGLQGRFVASDPNRITDFLKHASDNASERWQSPPLHNEVSALRLRGGSSHFERVLGIISNPFARSRQDDTGYQGDHAPAISDSLNFIKVGMGTYGITQADHSHPIIKTLGVGPCTAIVLYHPKKKIAALCHANPGGEAKYLQDIDTMLQGLRDRHGIREADKKELQVNLIGGRAMELARFHGYEDNELAAFDYTSIVERCLQQRGITNILFKETENAPLSTEEPGRNIAIDSRTGQIYNVIDRLPRSPEMARHMCITDDSRSL